MDDALGRDIPNKVWDDANIEEMASLEITRIHRNIDLEFLKADEDGTHSTGGQTISLTRIQA